VYLFGVYGAPGNAKSKYSLMVKRNETHIPLREAVTDWSYVTDG